MENRRQTRQKAIIRGVLKELYGCHPTAEKVFELARTKDSTISMSTVYRNLSEMAEAGIIDKLHGIGRKAFYDQNTMPHSHFICEKCGNIYDIPYEMAKEFSAKAAESLKCRITSFEFTAKGLCADCDIANNNK
ncbi:MAG: transcriptional repressor [Elusimicrobiales bacterium]|nr:transcriptional repressor [Elusimicrobiales bacterium]